MQQAAPDERPDPGPGPGPGTGQPPRPAERYAERLWVPLRWWVQTTMLLVTFWLALVVAVPGLVAWSVTAVLVALAGGLLLSYGSARVVVEPTASGAVLGVGRARIETHHLGAAEALDAEQTRRVAGREADVRAFLLLRPYLKRSVRVRVEDPADPTPYWLVSTRRPDDLVRALGASTPPPTRRADDAG